MRPLAVVEVQIPTERSACLANSVIGMQIDLLVLDRSPQPLDKDIITPRAATIHADRDRVLQQQAGERGAGELLGFNQSSQRSCALTVSACQMPLQVFSSQGFCEASC